GSHSLPVRRRLVHSQVTRCPVGSAFKAEPTDPNQGGEARHKWLITSSNAWSRVSWCCSSYHYSPSSSSTWLPAVPLRSSTSRALQPSVKHDWRASVSTSPYISAT